MSMAVVAMRCATARCTSRTGEDQRIYSQSRGGDPIAVTPVPDIPRGARYADLSVTQDGRFLICVRETHSDDGEEARNEVVCVNTSSGNVGLMATSADFCSSPRVCAAHNGVAWLAWNHPNMPWDGSVLMSRLVVTVLWPTRHNHSCRPRGR